MAAFFRSGPIITWIAWMVLLFSLSTQENPPHADLVFSWQDKLQHAAAYAILAFLTLRATAVLPRLDRSPTQLLIITLTWAALYGLSDEWHQSFVPGRNASTMDWLADVVGAAIALAALRWLRHRRTGL